MKSVTPHSASTFVFSRVSRIVGRWAALLAVGLLGVAGVSSGFAATAPLTFKSPDGHLVVTVSPGAHLTYRVAFNGKEVVLPSALGVIVDGQDLGQNAATPGKAVTGQIDEQYPVMGVHDTATNHCVTAQIPLTGGANAAPWQLDLRVYNDGVCYRYDIPGTGTRRIQGESTMWNVPVGSQLWSQSAENTSYEARYEEGIVGQLPHQWKIMAPATLVFPGGAGYGMMTEANLIHYSDLSLQTEGTNGFRAFFHNSPDGWDVTGEIVSPWRVTVLAADLNALVNSDIIKNCCPPPAPELAHADWIRPGRSIWHWLTGGAPKLDEQKAWIDGTKAMGYEYYLVDDGWRDWNGGGDNAWAALADLVKYAKSQGVDMWAWVHTKYVTDPQDRDTYFKRAKEIGLVGLKIDFMDPADAKWVDWYDATLRDAAALHLMVDFHGAVKPTGRERTWPNELTREAISGREQGKNPPEHDTALPFVRYVQGHADYTPTLLIPKRLKGSSFAHELAMAIVFTSPYLCMGDKPEDYLKSDAADVLKALPSLWDETRVLPSSVIGSEAAFARRHGDQWFIGVINGARPQRETVKLNFLGSGKYRLVELADNPDHNDAFARSERTVTAADTLMLPLRKDGGYVAWLVPEK